MRKINLRWQFSRKLVFITQPNLAMIGKKKGNVTQSQFVVAVLISFLYMEQTWIVFI